MSQKKSGSASLILTGLGLALLGLFGKSVPIISSFMADQGFLSIVLIGGGAISLAIGVYGVVNPEKEPPKRSYPARDR